MLGLGFCSKTLQCNKNIGVIHVACRYFRCCGWSVFDYCCCCHANMQSIPLASSRMRRIRAVFVLFFFSHKWREAAYCIAAVEANASSVLLITCTQTRSPLHIGILPLVEQPILFLNEFAYSFSPFASWPPPQFYISLTLSPSSTPFLLHWFISSDNSTADFTVNFWACLCDQIWSYRHLLYWELLLFWHLLNAVQSVLCKMTRKLFRCVTEIKGVGRTHWLCS